MYALNKHMFFTQANSHPTTKKIISVQKHTLRTE